MKPRTIGLSMLRHWHKTSHRQSTPHKQQGFTLIELLISIAVGSLIIGSLLYLVVELMAINRREDVFTQIQQDMQRAVDYITRDVSEAVFVYSDPEAIAADLGIANTLTPVLAFWRLDPIDVRDLPNCDGFPAPGPGVTDTRRTECNALRVRHNMYTLVVYLLAPNEAGSIWQGPNRVVRYEMPQFSSRANIRTLTQTPGYVDPSRGGTNSFEAWSSGANPGGIANVLVDRVDTGNRVVAVVCPAGYFPTNTQSLMSFFACLSNDGTLTGEADNASARSNQSVFVSMRGNATTVGLGFTRPNETGNRPTIESEVLVRGVVQKRP